MACLYQEASLIEQGLARLDKRMDEACLIDPVPEAFLLDAMAKGTAIIIGAVYVQFRSVECSRSITVSLNSFILSLPSYRVNVVKFYKLYGF